MEWSFHSIVMFGMLEPRWNEKKIITIWQKCPQTKKIKIYTIFWVLTKYYFYFWGVNEILILISFVVNKILFYFLVLIKYFVFVLIKYFFIFWVLTKYYFLFLNDNKIIIFWLLINYYFYFLGVNKILFFEC